MNEITNLNKARKAKTKASKKRKATANRIKHGRTKRQRSLDARQRQNSERQVDLHKLETLSDSSGDQD